MMKIDSVGILGAGAVGAAITHQMINEGNYPVTIIAEGARASRYRRHGINVNDENIRPEITDNGSFGLVIVATKSYNLDETLPLLDGCLNDDTLVMSLLNGIASEETLGKRFGHHRVVPAMILGIDALRDDQGVHYLNRGVIHYGINPLAPGQEPRIKELTQWFRTSGLESELSDDITRTLWRKFMINVGMNQVSAVLRAPYARFQEDPNVRNTMRSAMEEVVALSKLEGTGLTEKDIDDWIVFLENLNPKGKTSMCQDVEAGRRTEVDLFAGTVITLAEHHNLSVPVNRKLLSQLSGS